MTMFFSSAADDFFFIRSQLIWLVNNRKAQLQQPIFQESWDWLALKRAKLISRATVYESYEIGTLQRWFILSRGVKQSDMHALEKVLGDLLFTCVETLLKVTVRIQKIQEALWLYDSVKCARCDENRNTGCVCMSLSLYASARTKIARKMEQLNICAMKFVSLKIHVQHLLQKSTRGCCYLSLDVVRKLVYDFTHTAGLFSEADPDAGSELTSQEVDAEIGGLELRPFKILSKVRRCSQASKDGMVTLPRYYSGCGGDGPAVLMKKSTEARSLGSLLNGHVKMGTREYFDQLKQVLPALEETEDDSDCDTVTSGSSCFDSSDLPSYQTPPETIREDLSVRYMHLNKPALFIDDCGVHAEVSQSCSVVSKEENCFGVCFLDSEIHVTVSDHLRNIKPVRKEFAAPPPSPKFYFKIREFMGKKFNPVRACSPNSFVTSETGSPTVCPVEYKELFLNKATNSGITYKQKFSDLGPEGLLITGSNGSIIVRHTMKTNVIISEVSLASLEEALTSEMKFEDIYD